MSDQDVFLIVWSASGVILFWLGYHYGRCVELIKQENLRWEKRVRWREWIDLEKK